MSESPSTDAYIVFCTCPDMAVADTLAAALVEDRLAACVNILPGVVSVYRWQGETQRDPELLLMIKTVGERIDALIERVRQLHPYEIPEVIAHPVTRGHESYLNWVRQCTDTEQ